VSGELRSLSPLAWALLNLLPLSAFSVLHDGAPNVGAAWVQDAFTQVELVLCSLKLATEFLAPGGTFCTKVFRSKDYNNLLWVFNQLFTKVEATKPPSSRNVSAEIFVVCTGYLAPAKIDPKLLNPKYVFKDLELAPAEEHNPIFATEKVNTKDTLTPATLNVFHPEKKRKQREGYADGDLTLHKECGVMDFIRSADPIGVLGLVGRMRWLKDEDKKLFKHPFTNADIKASVEDLKVLGKKDFKNLLKYRIAIREDLGIDLKDDDDADELTEKAEVEPLDEEEQIAEELDRLAKEDALRRRRDRRKLNERKTRDVQRMQLNMVTPMDMGLERQDGIDDRDMFDLGEVEGNKHHGGIAGGLDDVSDSEGEDLDDETAKSAAARKKRVQLAEMGRAHAARRANLAEVDDEAVLDPEEEEERRVAELEAGLDAAYDMYHEHKAERDAKHKAKEERRKRDAAEGGEWHGIKAPDSDDETDVEEDPAPLPSSDDDSDDEGAPAVADGMALDGGEEAEDDDDEEEDGEPKAAQPKMSKRALKAQAEALKKQQVKDAKLITKLGPVAKPAADKSRAAAMWFDQPAFKGMPGLDKLMAGADSDEEEEEEDEEDEDEREWAEPDSDDERAEAEALKAFAEEEEEEDESDDDFSGAKETIEDASDMEEEADFKAQEDAEELKARRIQELGLTTGQAMTLAQQLVNRERTKTQMIDEGFNRYTDQNGGDGLPSWFCDDEQKHFRNNIPVTKEAVAAIREKMRALNARPIKKIAEAKARKKMRQIRRLDKVRQKAQGVNDDDENGLTEKDKAAAIAKILSKGSGKGKPVKKDIKIVVGRGQNKGIKGRPSGVKGRYKMLDARDRKESRALKRIAKRDKKGGGRRKK